MPFSKTIFAVLGFAACSLIISRLVICKELKRVNGQSLAAIDSEVGQVVAKVKQIYGLKLLVVTRIHVREASALPPIESIIDFIHSTKGYSSKLLICVSSYFFSIL
jgi:hypothetical protein